MLGCICLGVLIELTVKNVKVQVSKPLFYDLKTLIFQLNEEAHFGHLPPVIGEMLTNMALCYRKMGQLDDAEKMYQQ